MFCLPECHCFKVALFKSADFPVWKADPFSYRPEVEERVLQEDGIRLLRGVEVIRWD